MSSLRRSRRLSDLSGRLYDPIRRLRLGAEQPLGSVSPFLESVAMEGGVVRRPSVAVAAFLLLRAIGRAAARETNADSQLLQLRRYLADLDPGDPEACRLDLLAQYLEFPFDWVRPALQVGLVNYAEQLEHNGRWAEAISAIETSCLTYDRRMPAAEFVSAALLVGRLRRRLADWDGADLAYKEARQAAGHIGAEGDELRATNGMVMVLAGRGDLPAASALAEQAIAGAAAPELVPVVAITWSMLAAVRDRQDRLDEAVAAGYKAVCLQPDPEERLHALGDVGCLLARMGYDAGARRAFDLVRRQSRLWYTRTNAIVELLGLEARSGHELAFRNLARELGALRSAMPPSMLVDYLVQCATGHRRFGGATLGRSLLLEARAIAETHPLNQWAFRIDALLTEPTASQPETRAAGAPAPAVVEVLEGLRVLAEVP